MSESNQPNLNDGDFKLVTSKKRRRHPKAKLLQQIPLPDGEDVDVEDSLRRIESAKQDVLTSDFYISVLASLREAFALLQNKRPKEIICLGLGKIGENIVPRHQLALLLCLKEKYDVDAFVYDPIFSENEKIILKRLNLIVLTENREGKYKVNPEHLSIFYLPHCPKQLTNNLLWKNWGLDLNSCVIIANSLCKLIDLHSTRALLADATFMLKIFPYVTELAFINTYKYPSVFSDTSIHIFTNAKLSLLSKEFWEYVEEPTYTNKLELITKDLTPYTLKSFKDELLRTSYANVTSTCF